MLLLVCYLNKLFYHIQNSLSIDLILSQLKPFTHSQHIRSICIIYSSLRHGLSSASFPKLHYIASGIITPIGGRLVHQTATYRASMF